MRKKKKIEVVFEDGNPTVNTKGFQGNTCLKEVNKYAKLMKENGVNIEVDKLQMDDGSTVTQKELDLE